MDFTDRGTTPASTDRALAKLAGCVHYHAGALILCTLALLAGVATLDDHDAISDANWNQRPLADATLRYVAGDDDALETLYLYHERFYGAAFEVPLLLAERAFGLDDSRSVFLARHLLTHLFFLATGFAGYLLALRLFRSRATALFALVLFLLHPRIYAHSFFNSKDVPFLGLFMICLWLACRAFMGGGSREVKKKSAGSLGAFALCGVAAGLLVNLRVMGLAFVAVVAAMRVCDWWGARSERRLVPATLVAFLASAALAYYASMPYLWADPFGRFAELLVVLSNHPTKPFEIFQGEVMRGSALPPHYVPVWFAITTPPLALLLGAVGIASLARRGMAQRGELLRNTLLRFELLLAACVALPLLAIVALRPVMYENWHHTFFLWAPFALLAASGLQALADAAGTRRFQHLSRHLPLTPRLAGFAVHGLAALGLAAVVVQMARLHPHQSIYFNALATTTGADAIRTDRMGSEPLHKRYRLVDHEAGKIGYTYILGEQPDTIVNMVAHLKRPPPTSLGGKLRHLETFSRSERQRIAFDPNIDPDFYILRQRAIAAPPMLDAPDVFFPPVLYERRLHGSAVLRVATPDLSRVDAATAAAYRALYRETTARPPDIAGYFDVYRSEAAVVLVREACAPVDLHEQPELTVYPTDAAHPSGAAGFRTYTQFLWSVRIGSACLWWTPLPDRPVAQIRVHGSGWLEPDVHLDESRRRLETFAADSPTARSTFDVYWRDGMLAYVKAPCVAADVEAPFFLHVVPVSSSDLNDLRSQHGFENLDFRWHRIDGDIFDNVCLVERKLPDYPVAHIATGQFTLGGASLWRVELSAGR